METEHYFDTLGELKHGTRCNDVNINLTFLCCTPSLVFLSVLFLVVYLYLIKKYNQ